MLSLVPSQVVMKSQTSHAIAPETPRGEGASEALSPPTENYIGKLKEMMDSKVLRTVLHEITPRKQNDGFDATCTVVLASNGVSIVGTGWAPSKQKAKHLAARSAFENLQSGTSSSAVAVAAAAINNLAIGAAAEVKRTHSVSSGNDVPFLASPPLPLQPANPLSSSSSPPVGDPSKRLRGTRPNVDWRAITMSTLRTHPLFEALPAPEEVELNAVEDCQKFREVM